MSDVAGWRCAYPAYNMADTRRPDKRSAIGQKQRTIDKAGLLQNVLLKSVLF